MENPKAIELIDKMQADISKKFDAKSLATDLRELRPFALEIEDPTLTKVIRLTYEMLEEDGTFALGIPSEGEEDEVGEIVAEMEEASSEESLDYLLGIMRNAKNPTNREDLMMYRNELVG